MSVSLPTLKFRRAGARFVSVKKQTAERILLRPALRDYGGQVAPAYAEASEGKHSVQHHSRSADFFIITSGDDVFIFYLAKPIFFRGDVIRDINEKGLHVFDASVDVTLNAFHLFLAH